MLRRFSHPILRRACVLVVQTVIVCLGLFGIAAPGHAISLANAAPAAHGSSLVFVGSDGNVYSAMSDGTGQLQLTHHGTVRDPYFSPTESAQGTIAVARGKGRTGELLRLNLSGKRLNVIARPGVLIVAPQISPDGRLVAFSTFAGGEPCTDNTDMSGHIQFCFDVVPATHETKPVLSGWRNFENPSWIGNSRLLLFYDAGTLSYANTSWAGYQDWFNWMKYFNVDTDGFGQWLSGAASANGERLALLTHLEKKSQFVIQLFSGATDARTGELASHAPSLSTCEVAAPDGGNGADPKYRDLPAFSSISFSPDGGSIAFGFKGAIYVTQLASLTDCAHVSTRMVIKAGSDPSFAAA